MTKFKCWFTHQNCTELNVAAINPSFLTERNWKLNVVVNNQIFKYNHLRLGELNVAFNNQLTNWKIECCNQSCIFAKQASSVDSFKHNPCRSIVNVGACTFRPANTSIFQKMNFSWFHRTLTHQEMKVNGGELPTTSTFSPCDVTSFTACDKIYQTPFSR